MKPCPKKPLILVTTLFILSFSSARDTITPSTPLADNETLVSSDSRFALGFFTPPNSNNRYIGLWYNLISDHTILWVANRENPLVNSPGVLSVTKDGRLAISNQTSFVVWSTNATKGLTDPIAQLLDSGNLVVKQSGDASENYLWQGFNFLTDTLLPGMRLGVDFTTGINRTLIAWKSYNDPSPSTYSMYMAIKGDPEIYFCNGPNIIWRSGAWNGREFSGAPRVNPSTYNNFSFNFANNALEVTYSYSINDPKYVSRRLLNYTGAAQLELWSWDSNQWNVFWTALTDQCDKFGECGAYGLCDSNNFPICSCLHGFVPKNPQNWNLADWREGCVRNTGLDCKNGADGFMPVSDVKLPQSENAIVDMSLNLVQCRDLCLKNCSCVGYASANASGGGSGCVTWIGQLFDIRNYVTVGQDLYVRLAAADLPVRAPPAKPPAPSVKPQKSRIKVVAIIVSLVFGILLLSCICCFLWKRKRRWGVKDKTNEMDGENGLDLPLVDFHTIVSATNNFSAENKLGQGGFGPVYKGKLEEDQEVAVKRLCKTSQQGVDEFKNEVMLIAKLQHRNLVRLLGCCIHGEERMLIYEYMPNKSLDAFLFGKDETTFLSWRTRYQIIIGIARGLLYLHQDSRFRIIHRDLKASNILLDKDMIPKISDFGMARIFEGDETDFYTRKVVGTHGYMSPEYALEGTFSMKSDVFSFGVLVLEIVSGLKNRGLYAFSPHLNLLAHAWSLWSEGDILQLVQEGMSLAPTDVVLKCITIGLLCVQERAEDRPLMSNVIEMFGSDISSLPQPNQPGFVSRFGPLEIGRQEACSLNGVAITELSGR